MFGSRSCTSSFESITRESPLLEQLLHLVSGLASMHGSIGSILDDREFPSKAVLRRTTGSVRLETPRAYTKICPPSLDLRKDSRIGLQGHRREWGA